MHWDRINATDMQNVSLVTTDQTIRVDAVLITANFLGLRDPHV